MLSMIDTTPLYRRFGELVRVYRHAARLTQEEVAKRVGLSRTSITNIEKGRQKVLLHQFYDLAAAINTTPARLLPELLRTDRSSEIERKLREGKGSTDDVLDWMRRVIELPSEK